MTQQQPTGFHKTPKPRAQSKSVQASLAIRHMAQQLLFDEKNKHVNHTRVEAQAETKRPTK